VRDYKAESHHITLIYLSIAARNMFYLELAMAIADLWWFVYGDDRLRLICEEMGEALKGGETVTLEVVIDVYKRLVSEGGR
jgi:hypothetical protein